ncbi:DEKNAAC104808 [Brettanomyces naardenensis]|uniref:DEKNAAC104808 n=1 Tax=Brettanomyces naardenensis TaxID=13370 RepID=A0A448YRZ1_BRENA|nr:DEKNAAC104808 [Brettanomyces naardenensis]
MEVISLSDTDFNKLELGYSELPINNFGEHEAKVFDPRLPAALYLARLSHYLESIDNGPIDPNLSLRFSWKDWTDFDKRLMPSKKYLDENEGFPIQSCNNFIQETGLFDRSHCRDLTASEIKALPNILYPHFKMVDISDPLIARDARVLIAGTYLYHSFAAPKRILFVDSDHERVISMRTRDSEDGKSVVDDLVEDFLGQGPALSTSVISISEQAKRLYNNLGDNVPSSSGDGTEQLDNLRVILRSSERTNNPIEFDDKDFEWTKDTSTLKDSLKTYVNTLKLECSISPDEPGCDYDKNTTYQLYSNMLQNLEIYPDNQFGKYFHEAGYFSSTPDNGAHFDWRFFGSKKLSEYESTSALHKLIRSWLRLTRILGINTWISHGSLLGYYFNGLILKWDFDHDVQVIQESLFRLARDYNQSLVVDVSLATPEQPGLSDLGIGEFFIDVGSSFYNRERGNGNNAIDARFIDIHTGLFIDITSLASVKSKPDVNVMSQGLKKEYKKFKKDYNFSAKDYECFLSDRNSHFYTLEDISPLIPTLFEGEEAFVPQRTTDILAREYPKYSDNKVYQGHTWRNKYRTWISNQICRSKDKEGNSCSGNAEVRLDDSFQKDYISVHMIDKELLDNSDQEIRRSPAEVRPFSRVLRPDATLMKIANERMH